MRQSERGEAYQAALQRLEDMGLTYPCTCTRKDIAAAMDAPQEGALGTVYPGICRGGGAEAGKPAAIRLDMARALDHAGPLSFTETGQGEIALEPERMIAEIGDVVLARKDAAAAYHLAVVVDDAEQKVSHVTRGEDLFPSTPVHRLLQALLELPVPVYRHHRLIRDETGRRLAKRADDVSLAALREEGWTPTDIRQALSLSS